MNDTDPNSLNETASLISAVLDDLGCAQSAAAFVPVVSASQHDSETLALILSASGAAAYACSKVPSDWRDGLDGALFIRTGASWRAVTRRDGVTRGLPDAAMDVPLDGDLVYVRFEDERDSSETILVRFKSRARSLLWAVGWQSMAINLCALTVPFFTMSVYSRVIGAGADTSLYALMSGAGLVLALMVALRHTRNRTLARAHGRLSTSMSMMLLARYWRLPDRQATLEGARAQLRLGERAAEMFAPRNMTVVFDAPFIGLTLIALAFVGGWMVLIPLLYLALFLAIGLYMGRHTAIALPAAARKSAELAEHLDELVYRSERIGWSGQSDDWLARYDQTSRQSALTLKSAQEHAAALQAVAYVLGTGTALVTLVVGLDLVLKGDLVPATLIGTMLLTWRITGPAQALFLGLPRVSSMLRAWSQLATTLRLPTRSARAHVQRPLSDEAPLSLIANGLYYRFPGTLRPALTGLNFEIPPGTFVVVMGPNGSGKSLLLRTIIGLVRAQSGTLSIGGTPSDQFTPESLAARMTLVEGFDDLPPERIRASHVVALDAPYGPGNAAARDALIAVAQEPERKATFIVATHDTELAEHADLAIVLDQGALAYFGPVQKTQSDVTSDEQTNQETSV